jgi:hypothetical protein
MDLYRITKTDPRVTKPNVRYGTKARAAAMARQVRELNGSRAGIKAWMESQPDRYNTEAYGPKWWQPVTLTVERAVVVDWADVSQEFITS